MSLMSCLQTLSLLLLTASTAAAHYPSCNNNSSINHRSAQEVIAQLNLIPNDEKGYYVQTFEDADSVVRIGNYSSSTTNRTRSASTAIYYLLEGAAGSSYWHRVDAVEVWHYYAGAPLTLSLSHDDGVPPVDHVLGPDVFHGEAPQVVIPKGTWQSAQSSGEWTLVGTTVAPGFVSDGVELALPDWRPDGA
ncbi:RmlC-like cupin domain-containing protein [Hypoxylon sp. NC1633]|nr:RmlC-like cupin domain-containing protein [Hypoxylon sp. NC1633]